MQTHEQIPPNHYNTQLPQLGHFGGKKNAQLYGPLTLNNYFYGIMLCIRTSSWDESVFKVSFSHSFSVPLVVVGS